MITLRPTLLYVAFLAVQSCLAGQTPDSAPVDSFSYGEPVTYALGSKSTVFDSHFQCGPDGSVILLAYETYSDDSGAFSLRSLTPSGTVITFQATQLPNYGPFSAPFSFFPSATRLYALVNATRVDPADRSRKLGFSRFVLVFNYDGALQKAVPIEAGTEALSVAAFESGSILLVTQEKFSHRVRLLILDENGSKQSELDLFDEDYLGLVKGSLGDADRGKYLQRMLTVAQYLPYRKNLLIVPTGATLPVLEINERGVLRSSLLDIQKGDVLASMLPTNGRDWIVEAGTPKSGDEGFNSEKASVVMSHHELEEFDPIEGKMVRRGKYAKGLYPICQHDGEITFLATRAEDGRVQLLKGTFSH